MVVGDINKIDLSTSFFAKIIKEGKLYVDKTRVIENFLKSQSDVNLVARQRRMGKSLNMDTVRCFLTDKEDLRHLFKGLYIEKSPAWEKAHSAPVFSFDFRRLVPENLKEKLFDFVSEYIYSYCSLSDLSQAAKRYIKGDNFADPDGLYLLTESVYRATGKNSYILIDEYDKFLMDNYGTERYAEIRDFEKAFLSAGLKGNPYLEKALVTGVMRVSRESMFSDLNNIKTFDVFEDETYKFDYGFTEEEVRELWVMQEFDIDKARTWYNGINVGGNPVYNTYSMASFLDRKKFDCYWGMSGSMDIIKALLNDERWEVITRLKRGEDVRVPIENRISLEGLSPTNSEDKAFYSLLVQGGYLSLKERIDDDWAIVNIPNQELHRVWNSFILQDLIKNPFRARTMFDNINHAKLFQSDLEYFLTDRMSYHDLGAYKGEDRKKVHERAYHIFILGMLSAFEGADSKRPPSNRESGDGRYDIMVEMPDVCVIFELKSCGEGESPEKAAEEALMQIEISRYGAEVGDGRQLVKVGIGFLGKRCSVRVA